MSIDFFYLSHNNTLLFNTTANNITKALSLKQSKILEGVHSEGGLDGSEVSEVGLEEVRGVREVVGAHHLADAVHGQLRHAQVHRADAGVGGEPVKNIDEADVINMLMERNELKHTL